MSLQDDEKEILSHVHAAFGLYLKLLDRDSCDDSELCEAVHRFQNVIAMRVARRENPEFWKIADGGWSKLHSNPNEITVARNAVCPKCDGKILKHGNIAFCENKKCGWQEIWSEFFKGNLSSG